MNQNKYLPLKTRKEKINFLNGVMNGEKRISDLLESPYHVTMWKEDENDPDYFINFDGIERISKKDYQSKSLSDNAHHVTLNLNDSNI